MKNYVLLKTNSQTKHIVNRTITLYKICCYKKINIVHL